MDSKLSTILVAVIAVVAFLVGSFAFAQETVVKETVYQNVPTSVVVPTVDANLSAKVDSIASEVLKTDTKENKAIALATDELNSRDSKKDIVSLLNDELNASGSSSTVESYKDIVSLTVKDTESDVSGNDADVDFEVKVCYFLDGDDDLDDKECAKISVAYTVEDLDEDENYVDAESSSGSLSFVKFYDN